MPKAGGSRRPRLRLLPTVLLTVAILALPTVVYALGRSSSSFDIERITVTGTKLVPEKRVARMLRREFQGSNLFTVTADDVRETLSPLCYVAGVTVDRDFPGTLRIAVVEYEPAVYGLSGKRWYVIDGKGHVICEAGAAEGKAGAAATPAATASATPSPAASAASEGASAGAATSSTTLPATLVRGPRDAALDLPRTTVSGRVRPGAAASDPGLADRLRIVAALPGSLRSRLDAVQSADGRITLRFAGGPRALWGDGGRTVAKAIALRVVLARYASEGASCTFIDVSTPDRVLARPVLD